MAKRTHVYQQMPWLGGRNSTLDPAILPPNQLTIADNTLFSTDMARRKRNGFAYLDSSAVSGRLIGAIDYWANVASVKTQRLVAISNAPAIYSYTSGGVRTTLTKKTGSTDMVPGFSTVCLGIINEDLIMAFDNTTSPKKWNNQTGTEWEDLPGTPPNFAFFSTHKNRVFAAGVKAYPDRLFYSSVDNHEEWNGAGTSGVIDIKPGDGDPEGITAVFPTIKGALFVAKRDRLYRIDTSSIDDADWSVTEVSAGIGCIGHNAVTAIGQDDILYMSDKGVHAMSATQAFGDFVANFVSRDIQKEFNKWNKGRNKAIWMVHIPELNSVAISVSPEGSNTNVELHLFNIEDKQWYRFPSLDCESVFRAKIDNRDKLMLGTAMGRVAYLTSDEFNDYGAAISWRVKTGTIYPDSAPKSVKGFKKLSLFYKPKISANITAKFKIDNYQEQTLSFDVNGQYDALGTEFVLGSSTLGLDQALPSITLPVDGYGRGFSLELKQDGLDDEVEVYGFAVEYEQAGDQQESPEQTS